MHCDSKLLRDETMLQQTSDDMFETLNREFYLARNKVFNNVIVSLIIFWYSDN